MTDNTATDETGQAYDRALWREAFTKCDDAGWEADEITGTDEMTTALLAAYQAHKDDDDIVRAAIIACGQLYQSWPVAQLTAMSAGFAARLNGWAELAQDWLDDHHPGFPAKWLDLDRFGREEVRRESEVYVELGNELFVFTKPGYPQ